MKTDKPQPLVTVYMPTYNRVELLQRAVGSVLKQDYRNIELIVVDDNSTDGTHEYLATMADEDPRFKYFINEKNSGACVSRNKAIFAANGKFITGLDDDDYFMPHHISSLVKEWQDKKQDCIALYTEALIHNNNKIQRSPKKTSKCDSSSLICSNWIGNQIFTETKLLQNIGGFNEKFPAWQDIECWYRFLKFYNQYAYCTHKYTYVVDASHPHERITTRKIQTIVDAYNRFCNEHQLRQEEKSILKLQLNAYSGDFPNIHAIIKSLKYLPTSDNLKLSIKRLVIPSLKKFLKTSIASKSTT